MEAERFGEDFLSSVDNLFNGSPAFEYNETSVFRTVQTGDLERLDHLVRSGKSVNVSNAIGNTPLHLAAVSEANINIIKYLVAQDGIDINAINIDGNTPLLEAVRSDSFQVTQCLVDNGADVNLPNSFGTSPLHAAVGFPNIAHFLITHGAAIDALDKNDESPLHYAVYQNELESVCMLLYYNADVNSFSEKCLTPFLIAITKSFHAIQEVLFDYVDDLKLKCRIKRTITRHDGIVLDSNFLNGKSTLNLALFYDSPFVKEILDSGADMDVSSYRMCLDYPDANHFRMFWKKLLPKQAKKINLMDLVTLIKNNSGHTFFDCMDIILEESDNSILAEFAQNIIPYDMSYLIDQCADNKLALDKLAKLILLLIQHGYRLSPCNIYRVFDTYGYCELFKLLLFMDYDDQWDHWNSFEVTARLIFDINSNIRTRCREIESAAGSWRPILPFIRDVKSSCRFWACSFLLNECLTLINDVSFLMDPDEFKDYCQSLPKVPSLLELARDKTREHIVKRLELSTTCQYYTVLNWLNIPLVIKRILMFEEAIYDV